MANIGKEKHENLLTEKIQEYESKGMKVVRTSAKTPDAIVVDWINKKVIALEIVGKYGKEKKYRLTGGKTFTRIKSKYNMYDDCHIFTFSTYPSTK